MPQPETTFHCYGLGWFVESYRGHTLVHHSGNIDGFSSFVGLVSELDLGVVAFTNMNGSLLHVALAREVFDHYLGIAGGDWVRRYHEHALGKAEKDRGLVARLTGEHIPGTTPSHALSDYTGTYARPGYQPVSVALEGDSLSLSFNGWSAPLRHFSYDTFIFDDVLGELPPGIPTHFHVAEVGGSIDGLALPLHTEPDTDLVRFTRTGAESLG